MTATATKTKPILCDWCSRSGLLRRFMDGLICRRCLKYLAEHHHSEAQRVLTEGGA